MDWLNDNAGAVTAIATAVLVIVTAVYVKITGDLHKVSEDNLREIQNQHRTHEEQYRREKEEFQTTCVLPVQYRWAWNAPRPTMQGTMEVELDNIGPGPARDIEVRVVLKAGGNTLYRYASIPGLVAGGSRWVPTADATQGRFGTWGVENWGELPVGFGAPMTVEILCKTVRGDPMPVERKVILKGDDVHNYEKKVVPTIRPPDFDGRPEVNP